MASAVRMRLTLAVESGVWGGAEAYLAGLLAELPDRVTTTVLALGPLSERLEEAALERGTVTHVQPASGKTDLAGLWRLDRALRATAPDVLHLNQSSPESNRHLMRAALVRGVPVVPVLHAWSELVSDVQRRALGVGYRRCARVIAVSAALRDRAVQQLGLSSDRVSVLVNGVLDAPRSSGSGERVPVLVVVARLVPEKGLDLLVEAVRRLAGEAVALRVLVAGDGPLAEALAESSVGLPITWLGEVDDVPDLLRRADGFVLPSREEGLPLSLLEAMGSGLACVASRVGGVPGVLDGVGLLVQPDDVGELAGALERLVADGELRRELGVRAQRRAREQYSRAVNAAQTLEVYDVARTTRRRFLVRRTGLALG